MPATDLPPAGTVLVADEVAGRGRCPAAPLVEGELRRAGALTLRGALDPGDAPGLVVSWAALGEHALAVAARESDHRARWAARAALSAWLAAAAPRRVLPPEEAEAALVVGAATPRDALPGHAHRVEGPGDIRPKWLVGVRTLAIVATPAAAPGAVDAVLAALGGLGPLTLAPSWRPGGRVPGATSRTGRR